MVVCILKMHFMGSNGKTGRNGPERAGAGRSGPTGYDKYDDANHAPAIQGHTQAMLSNPSK